VICFVPLRQLCRQTRRAGICPIRKFSHTPFGSKPTHTASSSVAHEFRVSEQAPAHTIYIPRRALSPYIRYQLQKSSNVPLAQHYTLDTKMTTTPAHSVRCFTVLAYCYCWVIVVVPITCCSAAAFVTRGYHHDRSRPFQTTTTKLHYFHPHFPSFESSGLNSNADLSMNVYELERARSEFEHLLNNSNHFSTVQPAGAILPHSDTQNSKNDAPWSLSPTDIPSSSSTTRHSPPMAATARTITSLNDDSATSSSSFVLDHADEDAAEPCMMLLTNAARRFRELELTLLEALRDSDEAVEELIHLWTTERHELAAHALLSLQSGRYECSDGLVAEEVALTALCRTHPGWAEPWTRLATLLCYKGRMADALSAAEEAASVKPWHFEALNVGALVLTWVNQQQQQQQYQPSSDFVEEASPDLVTRATRLARQRLPPLSPSNGHAARRAWVDRAVALATSQLQCAEQVLQARAAASEQQHNRNYNASRKAVVPPPPLPSLSPPPHPMGGDDGGDSHGAASWPTRWTTTTTTSGSSRSTPDCEIWQ
jgi:hypothetical protein